MSETALLGVHSSAQIFIELSKQVGLILFLKGFSVVLSLMQG
jgi:hypothetical protein